MGPEGPLGLALPSLAVGHHLEGRDMAGTKVARRLTSLPDPSGLTLGGHLGNEATEDWYEVFLLYHIAASSSHLTRWPQAGDDSENMEGHLGAGPPVSLWVGSWEPGAGTGGCLV